MLKFANKPTMMIVVVLSVVMLNIVAPLAHKSLRALPEKKCCNSSVKLFIALINFVL